MYMVCECKDIATNVYSGPTFRTEDEALEYISKNNLQWHVVIVQISVVDFVIWE